MPRPLASALVFSLGMALAATAHAQAPETAFARVEVVPVPTERTLLGVHFPDVQHGYAVGAFGVILATTDGGATWRQQRSGVESAPVRSKDNPEVDEPADTLLRSVFFVDARHGWAVGNPDLILHTTDGGATWFRQNPPPITDQQGPVSPDGQAKAQHWAFSDVVFTDRQNGHVVGVGGTILTTTDGGNTWTWRGDGRFGYLHSVTFPDPRNGRAVGEAGGEQGQFVVIATDDGGRSWRMQSQRNPDADVPISNFDAVAFADAQRGHVVGGAGRILATSDGGRRWAVQRRDTTERFRGVAFADAKRGVAVGTTEFTDNQRPTVVATADGGETWVSRLVPGASLWDVTFATPTTAYAVGCQEFGRRADPDVLVGVRNSCLRSLVVRITFPPGTDAAAEGGGGGGFPLPLLIGAAVVVVALSGVLVARRRH